MKKIVLTTLLLLATLITAYAQSTVQLPIAAQAVADIGNGPIKVRVTQGSASIFTSQGSGAGSTSGSSTALTLTAAPTTPPIVGALISGAGITSGTTVAAYNGTTGITLSAAMTVPASTTVSWGAACPASAAGIPSQYIPASVMADYYVLYTQARVCAVSPGGSNNALLTLPVFYESTAPGGNAVSSVFGRTGAVVAATNDYNFNQLSGSLGCSQTPSYSGDISNALCVMTLAIVNSNVGTFGSATACVTETVNAKGLVTAISAATCTPAFTSLTGSIAAGQISNSLITYAKLQNETAATLLGNPTGGAAAPSEITLGTNLSFAGSVLNASGVWSNTLLVKTANYTIAAADCGSTIQAGTGATGFFTITLPAVAGFSSTCVVAVANGDSIRGKQLSGFPADLYCTLYPGQTATVGIVNGAWVTTQNPGRWRPAGTVAFNSDSVSGLNTCASDGLGTGAGAFNSPPYAYSVWSQHMDGGQSATDLVTVTIQDASVNVAGGWLFVGNQAPGYYATATTKPFRVLGKGPASTTVTSSTANATNFNLQGGAELQIDQMTISSTGSGAICITVLNAGSAFVSFPSTGSVNFGTCTNVMLDAAGGRASIRVAGPWGIVSSVTVGVVLTESGATGWIGGQLAVTGTVSVSTGVLIADYTSRIDLTGFSTLGGGITGSKGAITGNAYLFTNGLGCTSGLPGTTALVTATGGGCT